MKYETMKKYFCQVTMCDVILLLQLFEISLNFNHDLKFYYSFDHKALFINT